MTLNRAEKELIQVYTINQIIVRDLLPPIDLIFSFRVGFSV
jgi:hypothetical protein